MFDGLQTTLIMLLAQIIGSIIMVKYFNAKVSATLSSIFEQPIIKGAMSVLGKKSGEVRHQSSMLDSFADDLLKSPKMLVIKEASKRLLGVDIDEYVEEHGAADTFQMLMGAADMLGIDIMGMISGNKKSGLGSPQASGGPNPYL